MTAPESPVNHPARLRIVADWLMDRGSPLCSELHDVANELEQGIPAAGEVYLVEVGEYSYAHIVAVYTTEEAADKLAAAVGGRALGPLPLNLAPGPLATPPFPEYRYLEMTRDGAVVRDGEMPPLGDGEYGPPAFGALHTQGYYTQINGKRRWRLYVFAYCNDQEHIVKIANDLRVAILAGQKPAGGSPGNELPLTSVIPQGAET